MSGKIFVCIRLTSTYAHNPGICRFNKTLHIFFLIYQKYHYSSFCPFFNPLPLLGNSFGNISTHFYFISPLISLGTIISKQYYPLINRHRCLCSVSSSNPLC